VKCADTTAANAATGVACTSAPFMFIGTQTPKVTGSVANTVTIKNRVRLYALTDFKRGHVLFNTIEELRCVGAIGQGLCRANYFPNEFSPLYMAEATGTALSQHYVDQYVTSASFFKLREVSATYLIPEQWLHGMRDASFTLAARELHTWTDYRGLDPEGLVGTSDQAVTPPLQRILATLNVKW